MASRVVRWAILEYAVTGSLRSREEILSMQVPHRLKLTIIASNLVVSRGIWAAIFEYARVHQNSVSTDTLSFNYISEMFCLTVP